MTDSVSKEVRSKIMSSIRSKNTKPEIIVRKKLWSLGKRYRIHDKSIIGTPDISNKTKKIAIFIDGCFWHGCKRCFHMPKSNTEFWKRKIESNQKRRKRVTRELKKQNWSVICIWEHEIKKDSPYIKKITNVF